MNREGWRRAGCGRLSPVSAASIDGFRRGAALFGGAMLGLCEIDPATLNSSWQCNVLFRRR